MNDAPFDTFVTIVGDPGTGKTTRLRERAERFHREHPDTTCVHGFAHDVIVDLAVRAVRDRGIDVTIVDDIEAQYRFIELAAPFLSLEWDAIVSNEVDPEVSGARSPERFIASAFRLIRKLRDGGIDPATFRSRALAGAAAFYAKPPNFSQPDLLYATKEAYRDSLDVSPAELQRQYRREVDLTKVIAYLYERYAAFALERGSMTERDAVAFACECLRATPSARERLHPPQTHLFLDDAHLLTAAEIDLLETLAGKALLGVTVAGDPRTATSLFRGARPDRIFTATATRIECTEQFRSPRAIDIACAHLASRSRPSNADSGTTEVALTLHRARTARDEITFIADHVAALLHAGAAPAEIALLFRSVADVDVYEAALLDREIPVRRDGDVNIFADRRALDALALLWNVWDPFRHEWMLRTLANPAMGLSDASIALLCTEPPDAQTPLFIMDDEPAPTTRSGRWDAKRDLRLGWNVVRGERDAALSDEARERLVAFRTRRIGWLRALESTPFDAFVRLVWNEGLAREGPVGSARAQAQATMLTRLLARLATFREKEPLATLGDVLTYAHERSQSDLESCEDGADSRFVRIASIDAVRGASFDHVILPDVRAGVFPRWYVPDAFLFSANLGMIPKENVGDATAPRTAKFSYYLFRTKAVQAYNDEERRALIYALRRAKRTALVTACERATRGVTAPEFLEELRAAKLPGSVDIAGNASLSRVEEGGLPRRSF